MRDKVIVPLGRKARQSDRCQRDKLIVDNLGFAQAYPHPRRD